MTLSNELMLAGLNAGAGYLRGTVSRNTFSKRRYKGPSATQAQVRALARQVRRNTPELLKYRITDLASSTAASGGWHVYDYNISDSLISSTHFRDNVLGDKLKYEYFKLRGNTTADMIRIILYKPKKTDASMSTPAAGVTNLTTWFPEPTDFTILMDKTYVKDDKVRTLLGFTKKVGGMMTWDTNNSDDNISGQLRLFIALGNNHAVSSQFGIGWELGYRNK